MASNSVNETCEDINSDDSNSDTSLIMEFSVDNPDTGPPVDTRLGVEPYKFEPYLTDEDEDDAEETRGDGAFGVGDSTDVDIRRLQNNEWCNCNHCTAKPTVDESVCCTEQAKVRARMELYPGTRCITEHPNFDAVCLNEDVLQTAYYAYRQDYGPCQGNDWKRYTGYRQFVRWCYEFLGRYNRVPIPACVVDIIRRTFPQKHQDYAGFDDGQ